MLKGGHQNLCRERVARFVLLCGGVSGGSPFKGLRKASRSATGSCEAVKSYSTKTMASSTLLNLSEANCWTGSPIRCLSSGDQRNTSQSRLAATQIDAFDRIPTGRTGEMCGEEKSDDVQKALVRSLLDALA